MAPPAAAAAARRKKRLGGRVIRNIVGFLLIVGFAYLVHKPLMAAFRGTKGLIAGDGPARLFGGSVPPTISGWLSELQLQTGTPRTPSMFCHTAHRRTTNLPQ